MEEFEKSGLFYLGKNVRTKSYELLDAKELTTHAVCVGMTGSGKTGLGIALLEEAALDKIPAIIIDPKGDVADLALAFPNLLPEDFAPWVENEDPASVAKLWRDGLAKWDEKPERIQKYKDAVELTIYTPASTKGIPLSIINSFQAPPEEERPGVLMSLTSSLLGLLGINADPIKSKEHILIATIIDKAWKEGKELDIATLIKEIQKPPFTTIGALALDTFYPPKERMELSISLNNLLASPGFQSWMEGEPLDIQRLLYTDGAKPKLSIISIAHLSDAERMFFVTLLLNKVLSWMRLQPGTSSLRALLYMDEIFGYFPPTSMPPSKIPMLTLLKQARAYGLGVVLVTQNPVDLDYKGLANCGIWFIGKLQTDRDKKRVIEGLNGQIDDTMLDQVGNRTFILRSVYKKEPELFQTRWTLSYLKGPLTLNQIATLTVKKPVSKAPALPAQVVAGVDEYYAVSNETKEYIPKQLLKAKLHYVDAKNRVDFWQTVLYAFDQEAAWGTKIDVESIEMRNSPEEGATFEPLTSSLQTESAAKDLLYQNQTLDLFRAVSCNLSSKCEESESDFRARAALVLREKRDAEIQKIKEKYQAKISSIQEKMKRATNQIEAKQQKSWLGKTQGLISFGAAVLGVFMGRKSLSKAESTLRSAGRIAKESQDVSRAQESYGELQAELDALQKQMEDELPRLQVDPQTIELEKLSIRPRKSDIVIEKRAILWWPKTL